MLASVLLLMVFSSFMLAMQAHATEIMPYYNNVITADSVATISSTGRLTVRNSYDGEKGVTTKAVITTCVEKKVLGLFWTKVDIGTTDNNWVDTIYGHVYTGSHSVQLSSEGTYRITVNYVIYGSGGAADEITSEIIKEY